MELANIVSGNSTDKIKSQLLGTILGRLYPKYLYPELLPKQALRGTTVKTVFI